MITFLYLTLIILSFLALLVLIYWRFINRNDCRLVTRFWMLVGYFVLLNSFFSLIWVLAQTIEIKSYHHPIIKSIVVNFSQIEFIAFLLGVSFLILGLIERFVIPWCSKKSP